MGHKPSKRAKKLGKSLDEVGLGNILEMKKTQKEVQLYEEGYRSVLPFTAPSLCPTG